jgi:predicted amidohydrolase YtcJ
VAGAADLVLVGGRVTPGGRHGEGEVEALAVVNGRVAAVGGTREVRELAGGDTVVVDLGGRRVVPGLIDSHTHLVRAGLTWDDEVHWDEVRDLATGLEMVRARAAALGPGQWVAVVGGWHVSQVREGRLPTRGELDAVAPSNPVYVQSLYEEGVLNSAGLAATGAEDGPVRGLAAFNRVLGAIPQPDRQRQVASTRSMLAEFGRVGLTGAIDAGGFGMPPERYAALYDVWRRGQLTVRTRLLLSATERGGEEREIREWVRYVQPGFGDGLLRVFGAGEIVLFGMHDFEGLDPSFSVDDDTRGRLVEVTRLLVRHGWPVHIHAVLDPTIGAVLDAWEQVDRETPLAGRRFAIAHAETIGARNIRRAKALGVGIAVQDRLAYRLRASAAAWEEAAARSAPPLRDLLDAGVPVGAGTDATRVASFNPWISLWWLLTGDAYDQGPRRAERHRLSRHEALRLYTQGSAWFSADEGERGSLEVGMAADLAVLSADFLAVPVADVPSLSSVLTLVGGRVTHADGPFRGLETPEL